MAPAHSATNSAASDRVDPEAILRIASLELRARGVVEGFLSGLHRSPQHGFSAEFSEYRNYSPGDDLRYLDWKLLARTDRRYVKRFEDETNLRCTFLLDFSRSMSFGATTEGVTRSPKIAHAVTLVATLAQYLSVQRDAVGLISFADEMIDCIPARGGSRHLRRLMLSLEQSTTGHDTQLAAALSRAAELLKKRGIVVLVSDLLSPLEGFERALGELRARGQEVVLFRVLDPAEASFHFEEAATFEDLETGRKIYIDPSVARDSYREAFEEHRAGIADMCADHGVDLVDWATDRPLQECLVEFMQARMRRGRRTLHRPRGRQ
ncbi:MAG: hypothetical protein ACI841_001508 [Planctomycetota bacterium]|jgi:uncharacterized protein (DUF58 family)